MFCPLPFTELRIRGEGDCFICCPQWNNFKSIGNVFETPNLEEIWNSDVAREIRRSMFDQSFRFCNMDLCQVKKERYTDGFTEEYMERGPTFIALNYDPSCNLFCKMCRDKKFMLSRHKQLKLIEFQDNLLESKYFQDTGLINVTSNGDPFASNVFWDLFQKLTPKKFPKLKLRVRTHGLGLTPKNWKRLGEARRMMSELWISIDAATEPTYNIIRRGGKFDLLTNNLEFLMSIKPEFKFSLALHYIVQRENYHEMPAFVDFCERYQADIIWFAKVYQGVDMSPEDLKLAAVHRPDHPLHQDFLQVMRHPNVFNPRIDWTNMAQFVDTDPNGCQKSVRSNALPVLNLPNALPNVANSNDSSSQLKSLN